MTPNDAPKGVELLALPTRLHVLLSYEARARVKDYARANVEARVAELEKANRQLHEHGTQLYARAERLAEALRDLAEDWYRQAEGNSEVGANHMAEAGRRCADELLELLAALTTSAQPGEAE